MSYPVMPLGFLGSQGDNDTYRIERSLRFNSADSANLTRTPSSAGNRKTFTISFWAKRSSLSSNSYFIQAGPDTNTITSFSIGENGSTQDNVNLSFFDYQSGGYTTRLISNQVFRDPSAWIHFVASVDTTQSTASNRIKLYANGSEITSFSTSTYPSQNQDLVCNNNVAHRIGSYVALRYSDGYLTEYHFIDGQALTPSSFGETDAITGRWKAKAYSGTYGTNGFYLSFKNNANVSALGTDQAFADGKKAENNFWTVNNFSVTAGAGNDSLLDSPTNSGTSGNYCTLNPLAVPFNTGSVSNGNLDWTGATNADKGMAGSFSISEGKYYWECTLTGIGGSGDAYVGIVKAGGGSDSNSNRFYIRSDGQLYRYGSFINTYTSFTTNDIIGIAFDYSAQTISFYKNGTLNVTGTTASLEQHYPWVGGFTTTEKWACNFGQRPFAYTAPTGFRSLCTTNLPTPTIQKPSKYMDVVTYTGNGSSQTISSLGFSPDLVWVKGRSQTSANHILTDSVRGNGKSLMSNNTNAEGTRGATLSSNGFSFTYPDEGGDANFSAATYVAWAWDEAPIAGMDIVAYTGDGTNRTIAHNLGVAPKMVIVKARSGSGYSWNVWHSSLANTEFLLLESTAAKATDATKWNSTSPTSSVFSLGTASGTNENARDYIAYLFAEVEGFSKFGSYTGNGSSDGPFVWCGFRPRWVMVKRTDSSGEHWCIMDSQRSLFNGTANFLYPNLSNAEDSLTSVTHDFNSNGFKVRSGVASSINTSGATYIFAAFAESVFKYSRAR